MFKHIIVCFFSIAVAAGANGQSPSPSSSPNQAATPSPKPAISVSQIVAQYNKARSDAVKTLNQKYARNAKTAAGLFHDDGNQSRSDDANAWVQQLDSTDDAENMKNLAPGMNDRLGSLQQNYMKERAAAVLVVDKVWYQIVKAAQAATSPEADMKGATALWQIMGVMCKELGLAPPPKIVAARPSPRPANPGSNPGYTPSSRPPGQSAVQTDPSHPFGVEADKLVPTIPSQN